MYKRRIKIFLVLISLVFLVITARLAHLQILKGSHYRRQADKALEGIEFLPAGRGQILDRNGRILAIDKSSYDLCLDYRLLKNEQRWLRRQEGFISRRLRSDDSELTSDKANELAAEILRRRIENTWQLTRRVARDRGVDVEAAVAEIIRRFTKMHDRVGFTVREERQAHPVVRGLDEAAAARLKAKFGPTTIGALIRPSHTRRYPYGPLACHVIGFVGEVTAAEQDRLNMPDDQGDWLAHRISDYLPGDIIGKSGVEKMCEKLLRGRAGYRRYKKSSGRTVEESPAVFGRDVHLTMDIELQRRLTTLLTDKGLNGCIAVISVPRGEVLALVSVPGFDLNRYRRDFPRLVADTINLPLRHRAVARRYPPGSTVKPIAALAALASGKVNLETEIDCIGYLHSPNAFRCWIYKRGGLHGPLNVVGAIKNSCNIYFYTVGDMLRPKLLGEWFRMFGFADKPGLGLPEECAGTVPTEQWLMKNRNRRFRPADARFMAIGQGLITATPLHVANEMATIARNGEFLSPTLVLEGGPKRIRRRLPVKVEHIRAIKEGMFKVANERGGTAYKYLHEPYCTPLDVDLCGKTGTAGVPPQRVDSNGDGRKDTIVHEGDMAWFAGFAPRGSPQIAFAIVVEYVTEGGGASNAAPIAADLIRACKQLGYLR